MPPVPTSLSELVDQLGRTYSPFERLKILGRAWALLRKMTPEQRLAVATQLGLDHSDELVEAIAERSGGQASPALLALIERAQVKGREQLPQLIADLRDPSRRAERLRQGARAALEEAESALAGEAPEAPWLPPAAVAPPQRPPARPAPASAPRTQAAHPQSPPPAPAASASTPTPEKPPEKPQPVQAPAPAVVVEQPPALSPPPPAVQAAPPPPRREEAAPAPPATPTTPPRVPEVARPAPVRPAEVTPLVAQLAGASSLTERFHRLRQHCGEAKTLPADGLRAILEAFPDGWARRRALVALLRSGAPASLRDALALVETLGAGRDRLWCLGALADSREIPEGERQALLAMAASPVARRRLGIRLGGR